MARFARGCAEKQEYQAADLVKQLENGQRDKTLTVVAQLDFQAAFTSTNPRAVYRTFEAYGVPEQDIQLVRRMHQGSWYSVANSFGESAACALDNGMKQGDPPSPVFYISAKDPPLRMINALGKGWKLPEEEPMAVVPGWRDVVPRRVSTSDPASLFVDDLSAVTMGTAADVHMQDIVVLIERWEPWPISI